MSSIHEIVILGGNLAGVATAQYLFRQTIPLLKSLSPKQAYHVTIVSPSATWFFKIAAPRALVNATDIPIDQAFKSIASGFAQYSAEEFTFLQGTAVGINPKSRTVVVKAEGNVEKSIPYNSLVLATGTTSKSPLWTLHGDASHSIDALKALHSALPKAKTVLIGGAGAAGVETAGEIKSVYPEADVTIYSGGDRVLPQVLPKTSAKGQAYLEGMGVKVVNNVRILSSADSTVGQPTTVKLSDGTEKSVDIFIDATGGKPNTEYVPSSWLDEKKRVRTKDSGLRVQGEDAEGVYVIGDMGAYSQRTLMDVKTSLEPIVSSIAVDIAAQLPQSEGFVSRYLPTWLGGAKPPIQVDFKHMADTMLIPIGRKGGVGEAFGWQLPSYLTFKMKGQTFFMEKVDPFFSTGIF